MFTIALLGNSIGLFVVLKRSHSTSAMNLFIANMAIADLMLTCTMMPVQVNFIHGDVSWIPGILGNVTCKLMFNIIPVSIAATVFTMMFISFNQFYSIFYPLKQNVFRKPKILCTIIWILSLVLMVPYLLLHQIEYVPQLNKHFFFGKCGHGKTKTILHMLKPIAYLRSFTSRFSLYCTHGLDNHCSLHHNLS